ncbi:MAG: diadenylate cyclase CdaA [Acidobacteriota bacterium]
MQELVTAFSRLGIKDAVEIILVAFLIYQFLLLIKGTRGWQMTLGITALALFYYVARALQFRTIEWLLANFFTYIVFAFIVIFQSEIRRGLAKLGRGKFLSRWGQKPRSTIFEDIVLAATTLASRKIGALIVIEREIGLRNYIESGIRLDAFITYDLLITIFHPSSSLHDGAVIIQNDRISAAGCFLPLTLDPYLSKELGTRHRAAIGITEETDAVAVVVSEETGTISLVRGGEMTRNLDGPRLLKLLRSVMEESEGKKSGAGAEVQLQRRTAS